MRPCRSSSAAASTRAWAGSRGRVLGLQERLATRYATAVITVNEALGDRLLGSGVPAEKLTIVPNVPSLARFDPAASPPRPFMADGRLVLVYAGGLSPIYELDVVLDAIGILRARRPALPVALELYGRDFEEVPLHDQAERLGIADAVTFHGRIPIGEVPAAIAAADVGLAPTRRTEFTDYSLSTKAYEYAAMDRTVVASRLPLVERTFGDDVVTYAPGDAADLATALEGIVDDPAATGGEGRARSRARGRAVVGARGPCLPRPGRPDDAPDERDPCGLASRDVAVRYAPRLSPEPTGHAIRTGSSHPMTFRAKPVVKRTHKAQWESQDRRNFYTNLAFGLVVLAAVLILLFAAGLSWYNTHLASVGSVDGQSITKDDFKDRYLAEQFRHQRGGQPHRQRAPGGSPDRRAGADRAAVPRPADAAAAGRTPSSGSSTPSSRRSSPPRRGSPRPPRTSTPAW